MKTRNASWCVIGVCLMVAVSGAAAAADEALWLRYPSISPDGETVVFSTRGDLWKVSTDGGLATQLTVHAAHDFMPVWSGDGEKIAFASDRYGNYDIFTMPAAGGSATRLTFHSADDFSSSFSPDGESVLFWSGRLDAQAMVGYPRRGAQPELYSVATTGGMPIQVLTTPAVLAVWDSAGERLAYSDDKALETDWRKHDNSSFARDVWLYDAPSGTHTRLTDFGADDRNPVWAPGEESLYFLSERGGDFNVWSLSLEDDADPVQITDHEIHPVRFLSVSAGGDLCYAWDGSIYTSPAGATESNRISVTVASDSRHNEAVFTDVGDSITDFALSPDGKQIAFIARGEVFVTSTKYGETKRLTNTPEQERSVSFHPGGRGVLYASERDGSWNIYRTDLTDGDEPSLFLATAFKEIPVVENELETFQPHYSPDGKEVAYFEERTTLKVLNLDSGETRIILSGDLNYSYADGDQWYEWSPDGQWFLVHFLSPSRWSYEVGLIASSGEGDLVNLTKSGYEDIFPRWAFGGEGLFWFSDRHGPRQQSGWPAQFDVYAAFLTQKAWDRIHLSEAEFEQLEAKEEKEEKAKKDKEKGDEDDEEEEDDAEDEKEIELPDPVDLQLEGIEDRIRRMTLHSSRIADARITSDGEKILYLARFEKGYDLWVYEPRKKEVKMLAKLGADDIGGLILDAEDKTAFVLADRALKSVAIEDGKTKPVKLTAKMMLDAAAATARSSKTSSARRSTRRPSFSTPDSTMAAIWSKRSRCC